MPRKSANTSRGSNVALHKRRRAASLCEVIRQRIDQPWRSIRELARAQHIGEDSAQRRWKKYERVRASGVSMDDALKEATCDDRGGHNT